MAFIEIKGVNFCYKQNFVLENLELTIRKNSIYALVGKAKSGKTTVIKMLLGLLKIPVPAMTVKGIDCGGDRQRMQFEAGSIVDLPRYQTYLTVEENFKYIDMLYTFGDFKIKEMMAFVGLSKYAGVKVRKLKKYQMRLLSIGLSMYHNPDILIFDDLYKDVDVEHHFLLNQLLKKIQKLGKTIILSSRDISDVSEVSTDIWCNI